MIRIAIAAAATFCLCSCVVRTTTSRDTGPATHDTQGIELGKTESARLNLKMGAGELQLDGGSSKLVDADFDYNPVSWKPEVQSNTMGSQTDVRIQQPSGSSGLDNVTYKWALRLNQAVPFDIVTNLGAGEARMNLGDVRVRSLQVHMGVGSLKLDLRGTPKRDCDVEINGGVGEVIVQLPNTVAITAQAKGGIGGIDVEGLEKRGDRWFNPAHEHGPVTIRLDVKGGVGHIKIVAE